MKKKYADILMEITEDLKASEVDMTLKLEEPKRKEYTNHKAKVIDTDKKKKMNTLF